MSQRTAVYRLFNEADVLLYVGISANFGLRWQQHAKAKPWWPEVHHQTITWYDSREDADEAETEAIGAEKPVHNIAKVPRPPRVKTSPPRDVEPGDWDSPPPPPAGPSNYLSTVEVAAKVGTTRQTVEREIERGNLTAKKVGRTWVIARIEADRWAAEYRPYAALRGKRPSGARPVRHASPR